MPLGEVDGGPCEDESAGAPVVEWRLGLSSKRRRFEGWIVGGGKAVLKFSWSNETDPGGQYSREGSWNEVQTFGC